MSDLTFDQGAEFTFTLTISDSLGDPVNLTGYTIDAQIVDVLGKVWGRFEPLVADQAVNPGRCQFVAVAIESPTEITLGTYRLDIPSDCHTAVRVTPVESGPIYPDIPRTIRVRRTPQALIRLHELANQPAIP